MEKKNEKSVLVLSDGSVYYGSSFGASQTRFGEIVFSTNMTGYEESLTDPSYAGQILVLSYPLIGNYGTNDEWCESKKMHVEGFVVRNICDHPSHNKSTANLPKRMSDEGIPGISGIDTRALVKKIRTHGVMPACISQYDSNLDIDSLITKAKSRDYSCINYVEKVSCGTAKSYGHGHKRIVLFDFGVKMGIIREMNLRNVEVVVVPYNTSAQEALSFSPHGILLSNGPGDPMQMKKEASEVRLLFDYPIFGICLGLQLIAMAANAKTYKLKFGHRGGNHPVYDLNENKVTITTQNHGFAVDKKSLPFEFAENKTNLTDGTLEGLSHKDHPIFAVQYHPEANPGPCDSKYLFDKFAKML